jgi:hypothetical protein
VAANTTSVPVGLAEAAALAGGALLVDELHAASATTSEAAPVPARTLICRRSI